MNSAYTRSPQQKINRVRKASAGLMPMIVILMMLMAAFAAVMYHKNLLRYRYEEIESSLIYALLGGAVINVPEYMASGNMVIGDGPEPEHGDSGFINSYLQFRECLRCGLGLDSGWNASGKLGISGPVEVLEYRAYNYISDTAGFHVIETGIAGGTGYTRKYPDNAVVYVEANDTTQEITETCVYAKISFTLQVGREERQLVFTRLIGVTD